MKKIQLKVNGMVCNGCENRVKNTLKNIDGITKVNANYKNGIVTILLKKDVEKNILIETIKNLGYEVFEED